nr:VP1 [Mobuck virus]
MAVVVQRRNIALSAAARILPGLQIDENAGYTFYYKYSKLRKTDKGLSKSSKNIKISTRSGIQTKDVQNEDEELEDDNIKEFYGLPVIKEASWTDLIMGVETSQESENAINILIESAIDDYDLEPEEEFLRNYRINSFLRNDGSYKPAFDFVMSRARDECQVFGDLALKHWAGLLMEISKREKFFPLGLQVMKEFISRFGEPFHQNTRDLSQIKNEAYIVTVVLFFEMCISESFSELNALFRCKEERLDEVEFGGIKFQLYQLVRELFIMCIPHPKYINNKLRATYSWFVKCWGVGADEIIVLHSVGGDDRNSKEVGYVEYRKFQNPYKQMINHSNFFDRTKNENIKKVLEMVDYVKTKTSRPLPNLLILRFLEEVYTTPFNPKKINDVLIASYLLSIQTITGYGRAWVKNLGDDESKMLKPDDKNFVRRLADMTENFVIKSYEEAERNGFTIVRPESMYSSLLRMAKNTSSGMSTSVEVVKTYGPSAERRRIPVRITSRQKALVLMREGDKIYKTENMERKFNTPYSYQAKGQRDVPIKATRTIYSIHISVLAPQLLLSLPINEYFSRVGGSTRPNAREIGGKIIIGDLESTGSRVIDACDTFRNTADPSICTLALDYSEYDQHMTIDNFRNGMMRGMEKALHKYSDLRYEGMTVYQLLQSGYGDGRLIGSLWNGKRHVMRMSKDEYENLEPEWIQPPEDAPFKFSPPGVRMIKNFSCIKDKNYRGSDYILVSPWDGSDLAKVTTHLSGENTTLAWNSVHNLAAGTIIREEIAKKSPNKIVIESETYVGDDMLMYTTLNEKRGDVVDEILTTIFDTIKLFGHEASESKTTFLPFSAEKTQTHAKQGIYIGQDRMMFVSSERRKDIEDVQSYMRANVNVFITKCSRGFSAELAHLILCYKTIFVGYRKFKRSVLADGRMRSRYFDSNEDGFTLCVLRNPLTLYVPSEWNGYGAHPSAINVVMTPEIFLDCFMMDSFREEVIVISRIAGDILPGWNETKADKHGLKTKASMSLFSKLARRAVSGVLQDVELTKKVQDLPLQGFGPTQISSTMMHSALLKEPKARTLLSPNYEVDYQDEFNNWRKTASIKPAGTDLQITTQYCKIFEVEFESLLVKDIKRKHFPDVNLSPELKNQKLIIGNRSSVRKRMSYVDQIDSILRGDVIMRGFVTSNHILAVLEEIGVGYNAEDYAAIFSLMNLDEKVSEKLGNYIARDKLRFDAQKLNKSGACGDEFSMSLDVCTQEMVDKFTVFPYELTQTERDAVALYASQMIMLRAAKGIDITRMHFKVTNEHKRLVQRVRMQSKLPARRHIKTLCTNIRSLSGSIITQQFI